MVFWKYELAQSNGNILGYFLFKQIYYIFILKRHIQNIVYCRYFKVSKVVRYRYFGLSNWTLLDIFWHFFGLEMFGVLFEKMGIFFETSGHPVSS